MAEFCPSCGKEIPSGNFEFCPHCSKPLKAAASISQTAAATKTGPFSKKSTKWAVIGIILLIVILVVPVIPVQKTIMVAGTTATTVAYQVTSFQTVPTVTQQSVSVYVGTLSYVTQTYYNYYYSWYSGCSVGFYGVLRCGYNYWPQYNFPGYTTTVTVSPGQNIISVASTQGSYGLSTVTLTALGGGTTTYTNVVSNSLSQSGTSSTQATTTIVNTITQTTSSVTNVACQNCIPQQVTEYVSILQLLTGNY
ncbi:MAG: hypothetical protein ACLPY5_01880 [Candidatus Bathyarchaeia archaeon]